MLLKLLVIENRGRGLFWQWKGVFFIYQITNMTAKNVINDFFYVKPVLKNDIYWNKRNKKISFLINDA